MSRHVCAAGPMVARAGVHRLIGVILGLALIAVAAPKALAAETSCPSIITSCGCVITKPGVYDIDADLDFSQGLTSKGDCIDIKAKGVILDGDGALILGNNSGAGSLCRRRVCAGLRHYTLLLGRRN